jgi:hypothetical protein
LYAIRKSIAKTRLLEQGTSSRPSTAPVDWHNHRVPLHDSQSSLSTLLKASHSKYDADRATSEVGDLASLSKALDSDRLVLISHTTTATDTIADSRNAIATNSGRVGLLQVRSAASFTTAGQILGKSKPCGDVPREVSLLVLSVYCKTKKK